MKIYHDSFIVLILSKNRYKLAVLGESPVVAFNFEAACEIGKYIRSFIVSEDRVEESKFNFFSGPDADFIQTKAGFILDSDFNLWTPFGHWNILDISKTILRCEKERFLDILKRSLDLIRIYPFKGTAFDFIAKYYKVSKIGNMYFPDPVFKPKENISKRRVLDLFNSFLEKDVLREVRSY